MRQGFVPYPFGPFLIRHPVGRFVWVKYFRVAVSQTLASKVWARAPVRWSPNEGQHRLTSVWAANYVQVGNIGWNVYLFENKEHGAGIRLDKSCQLGISAVRERHTTCRETGCFGEQKLRIAIWWPLVTEYMNHGGSGRGRAYRHVPIHVWINPSRSALGT